MYISAISLILAIFSSCINTAYSFISVSILSGHGSNNIFHSRRVFNPIQSLHSKTYNKKSVFEQALDKRNNNKMKLLALEKDVVAVKETTTTDRINSNHQKRTVIVRGCRDLVNDYDVFLLDMWGVMHDGIKPYEGVVNAVQKLHKAGKRLIIVSNSSKRIDHSAKMLRKLGFDPDCFEQIITSGEVAFQMLSRSSNENESPLLVGDWYDEWDVFTKSKKQRKVFIFGSDDKDIEYCESAGWSIAPTLSDASLIIARGTFSIVDGTETNVRLVDDPELYEQQVHDKLQEAARLRIPMLVCNPDKIRPDADQSPMPGRIGDLYERELKKAGVHDPTHFVKRVGKPFGDVYEIALQRLAHSSTPNVVFDRSRVCMVGDALETDVAGGSRFGLSTVWVLKDGVYMNEFNQNDGQQPLEQTANRILKSFSKMDGTYATGQKLSPTFIMPHFRW